MKEDEDKLELVEDSSAEQPRSSLVNFHFFTLRVGCLVFLSPGTLFCFQNFCDLNEHLVRLDDDDDDDANQKH